LRLTILVTNMVWVCDLYPKSYPQFECSGYASLSDRLPLLRIVRRISGKLLGPCSVQPLKLRKGSSWICCHSSRSCRQPFRSFRDWLISPLATGGVHFLSVCFLRVGLCQLRRCTIGFAAVIHICFLVGRGNSCLCCFVLACNMSFSKEIEED
jgi:hypothetical protein